MDTKQNILKASFVLFLEKGFKDVTIKNIIDVTKLSKGAIYHYFQNKEEIYLATLEYYYFDLLAPEEIEVSDDFKTNVKMLYTIAADMFGRIENVSDLKIEFPIRRFFSFQLESESNEIIRNKIFLAVTEYRKRVMSLVELAFKKKQIKESQDIETVTLQIISTIEGIAIHNSTHKENIKEFLMNKYELVFNSYLNLICK